MKYTLPALVIGWARVGVSSYADHWTLTTGHYLIVF